MPVDSALGGRRLLAAYHHNVREHSKFDLTESRFSFIVESEFGFTGKSNSLDSWALSKVAALLFVYVCDIAVLSMFLRIFPVSPVNPRQNWIYWIRESEFEKSNYSHARTHTPASANMRSQ